jgi:hypothetical protein
MEISMAKRVVWKAGDVVSIKLREDLFTIGQMMVSPVMRFFDIISDTGQWNNVDLNQTPILFRVFVGNVIRYLIYGKVKNRSVIPCYKPYDPYWIKPYTLSMDGYHYKGDRTSFPFLGGRIISIDPSTPTPTSEIPIIQEDLSISKDRKLIEELELTNMWGHEGLSDRLCRYFDTGINRDDLKFEVFPGLWDDREALRPLTRRLPVPYR